MPTKHHLIPKSLHSKKRTLENFKKADLVSTVAWVCRSYLDMIHRAKSEAELASDFRTLDALKTIPELNAFVEWIRNKPANFVPKSPRKVEVQVTICPQYEHRKTAFATLCRSSYGKSPYMTDSSGIENRRSPRRGAGWRAIVKAPDKVFYQGKTVNVSAQGLLVEMERQFPPNSLLMLKIEVVYKGEKDEFVLSARVRHNIIRTSNYLVGLQIVKMDEQTEDFLYDYSHMNI